MAAGLEVRHGFLSLLKEEKVLALSRSTLVTVLLCKTVGCNVNSSPNLHH
jgi:hypothetical protein